MCTGHEAEMVLFNPAIRFVVTMFLREMTRSVPMIAIFDMLLEFDPYTADFFQMDLSSFEFGTVQCQFKRIY